MTDDPTEDEHQAQFLHIVRARLQVIEDHLMAEGWQDIVVSTDHGSFEWRLGGVEKLPADTPARRKSPAAPGPNERRP
jgi:hypothetical protein